MDATVVVVFAVSGTLLFAFAAFGVARHLRRRQRIAEWPRLAEAAGLELGGVVAGAGRTGSSSGRRRAALGVVNGFRARAHLDRTQPSREDEVPIDETWVCLELPQSLEIDATQERANLLSAREWGNRFGSPLAQLIICPATARAVDALTEQGWDVAITDHRVCAERNESGVAPEVLRGALDRLAEIARACRADRRRLPDAKENEDLALAWHALADELGFVRDAPWTRLVGERAGHSVAIQGEWRADLPSRRVTAITVHVGLPFGAYGAFLREPGAGGILSRAPSWACALEHVCAGAQGWSVRPWRSSCAPQLCDSQVCDALLRLPPLIAGVYVEDEVVTTYLDGVSHSARALETAIDGLTAFADVLRQLRPAAAPFR